MDLTLEEEFYYEVEVESSVREYEFLVDAASGRFSQRKPIKL
ncbi:hypothetical protein ON064_04275 [Planococcus sp. A6]|nr:PepSY domain-containing protein [Planococcus sp. A6]MDE0582262.1 hypothetical protein [Planococcus sp. A6]